MSHTMRARLLQVAVSLAVGVTAYVVTNFLVDDGNAQTVTLSVLFAGVTMVLQVLVEFEGKLAELGHKQQRGFNEINDATKLFSLVEESALRSDVVIQLVRHSTELDPQSPPLIRDFAQMEIGRMSGFLKELARGNVTYDGEDRDWMLALTRSVTKTIDATSLSTVDVGGRGSVDGGLWTSDLGQRYLEAQRDAIQRGVQIRRLFIMNQQDLAQDPNFLDVCHRQRDMNIDVKILDSSAVPGIHRSSLFDFVLFDDVISYEVTPASTVQQTGRPPIVNTRLELDLGRVRDRMTRFKDLWASARDL